MSQPPYGPPGGYPPGGPQTPIQHLPAAGQPPRQGPPPGSGPGQPPPPAGYPGGPPPFGPHQPGPHAGPHQPGPHHPGQPVPHQPGAHGSAATAVGVLALVSVAATVVGLSVDENGSNAWHSVHAWGGLAIVGAVLTFAPVLAGSLGLSPHRAWQVAACGAGALALFWVLFVLPSAGSNTSLVTTVGAGAGIIAAWVAPGREDERTGDRVGDRPGPTW